MASISVKKMALYTPSNEEVSQVFQKRLESNFAEATCAVVDCPDLTQPPWGLCMGGLSGSPCIGEIGGVRFLCPIAQTQKIYNLKEVANLIGYEDGLLIGAGAGPHPYVGKNSEMIPNLRIGTQLNESRIAKTSDDDSKCFLEKLPSHETRCALLMNFYACAGISGPVIKVRAKKRTGQEDFVGCMRKALTEHYGTNVVGIGGTFIMKTGSAKIHVMPDFSKSPLKSESDVNAWLKFFDMEGPMNFMSVFVSRDPDLNFRVEHTHGYSSNEGGHYHFDTTPDEVEYEGYFGIAQNIYRIDKP